MEQFLEQLLNVWNTIATWENVVQVAVLVVAYFGADSQLVGIINWLKEALGWADKKAELLTISVVTVVTIFTFIAEGVFVPENLTLMHFATIFTTVFYAAQKRYQRIKIKKVSNNLAYVDAKTDALIQMVNEVE